MDRKGWSRCRHSQSSIDWPLYGFLVAMTSTWGWQKVRYVRAETVRSPWDDKLILHPMWSTNDNAWAIQVCNVGSWS